MADAIITGPRQVVTKSSIGLRRIYKADFQKAGTLTAEIEQIVTTDSFYPSKRVETSAQSGLFATEDFGFTEQHFQNKETRIAWIPVPEAVTEEKVLEQLAKANAKKATIYKVMSSEPYLDENQEYAIKQQMRTRDDYANRYVVRYPKNHDTRAEQLVLTGAGFPQYRRTFFWNGPKEDMDLRDASKTYMSIEIAAELGGVQAIQNAVIGQTLNFDPNEGATAEESATSTGTSMSTIAQKTEVTI